MTPPTMAEPGVKLFLPYRSPTKPSLFFIFELYTNEAGWKAHEATDHFKVAIEGLLPRLARRLHQPPFRTGASGRVAQGTDRFHAASPALGLLLEVSAVAQHP
jgi:hypothetical protein